MFVCEDLFHDFWPNYAGGEVLLGLTFALLFVTMAGIFYVVSLNLLMLTCWIVDLLSGSTDNLAFFGKN